MSCCLVAVASEGEICQFQANNKPESHSARWGRGSYGKHHGGQGNSVHRAR
jgi:hypothetical protein